MTMTTSNSKPSKRTLLRVLASLQLCMVSFTLHAQSGGRLYDPEPPVDSGYLRVVIATPTPAQDVWIDGQARIQKLPGQVLSEYMVLVEGKHTLSLQPAGAASPKLTFPLEITRGKSVTLAFSSLRPDTVPVALEDKGNTNKLKVMLTAYHLAPKVGALDVMTADGSAKVFSNLAFAQSASLQVNPISVNLIASPAGGNGALAKFPLEMAQGGTYSVLFTADAKGKLSAQTVLNKTERFTGK
jgi:alginate O-acetyltransferase complex protein AlgF